MNPANYYKSLCHTPIYNVENNSGILSMNMWCNSMSGGPLCDINIAVTENIIQPPIKKYREISNISYTKSRNLNASRLVLHLSLLNQLMPGVK